MRSRDAWHVTIWSINTAASSVNTASSRGTDLLATLAVPCQAAVDLHYSELGAHEPKRTSLSLQSASCDIVMPMTATDLVVMVVDPPVKEAGDEFFRMEEKHMPWSTWIQVSFDGDGTLNRNSLAPLPQRPGVYAIASKKSNNLYVIHYVGRSKNIQDRLQRHLTGHGNSVIASQLVLKKRIASAPASVCVAYLETH